MNPQIKLGIYVRYESPSIIKYLKSMTGDLFRSKFSNFHFDELVYLALRGENKQLIYILKCIITISLKSSLK